MLPLPHPIFPMRKLILEKTKAFAQDLMAKWLRTQVCPALSQGFEPLGWHLSSTTSSHTGSKAFFFPSEFPAMCWQEKNNNKDWNLRIMSYPRHYWVECTELEEPLKVLKHDMEYALGLPDLESWEDIWTRDRNVLGNTNHGFSGIS